MDDVDRSNYVCFGVLDEGEEADVSVDVCFHLQVTLTVNDRTVLTFSKKGKIVSHFFVW